MHSGSEVHPVSYSVSTEGRFPLALHPI